MMNRKKAFGMLFCCVMFLFLGACKKKTALHVYEYFGQNDDTSVFRYEGDIWAGIGEKDKMDDHKSAAQNRQFVFLGQKYDLCYTETETKEFLPYAEDYYFTGEGTDLEVSFKEGTDLMTGIYCYDGLDVGGEVLSQTEEEMKKRADSLLKEYIALEEYDCSCSSEVIHFEEQNGEAESYRTCYNYFYNDIQETDQNTVLYTFTYNKRYQGYRTCEMALVTFTEKGLLYSLQLNAIGMFSSEDAASVGQAKLQESIAKKMNRICKEGYRVQSLNNDVTLCKDRDDHFFYVVAAVPMVVQDNGSIASQETCIFIVVEE